jgi:hypothetical protein
MPLERIDQLSAPPIPGNFYLVPMVHGQWYRKIAWWPVWGEKHEDAKFFRFPEEHYHLDRRFLPQSAAYAAVGTPLHARDDVPLSAPEWRRRKCITAGVYFPTHPSEVKAMQGTLSGAQCKRDDAGWICPHRGMRLGSIAPGANGEIICPLHGLRINAATGIVS